MLAPVETTRLAGYTLKIAPIFLPITRLAPMSVTASSAMPQTPMAQAMYRPSPRLSKSTKIA